MGREWPDVPIAVGTPMQRFQVPLLGLVTLTAILLGGWAFHGRFPCRLASVEVRRPFGESFHTEDPVVLDQVEAWCRSLEGPTFRQVGLRFVGGWNESGLRVPDHEVTLVLTN